MSAAEGVLARGWWCTKDAAYDAIYHMNSEGALACCEAEAIVLTLAEYERLKAAVAAEREACAATGEQACCHDCCHMKHTEWCGLVFHPVGCAVSTAIRARQP